MVARLRLMVQRPMVCGMIMTSTRVMLALGQIVMTYQQANLLLVPFQGESDISVIASAAKQSPRSREKPIAWHKWGLLRRSAPRNDMHHNHTEKVLGILILVRRYTPTVIARVIGTKRQAPQKVRKTTLKSPPPSPSPPSPLARPLPNPPSSAGSGWRWQVRL